MNAAIEAEDTANPLDICTVVVIYDDAIARTRAMTACDYLVNQFWENVELEFHWWRTDFLEDTSLADLAARNAIEADFLIVCVGQNHSASPSLEAWFENWIARRHGREGALLDLSAINLPGNRQTEFLREICGRGSFDYLTPAPTSATAAANPSWPPGRQGANLPPELEGRRSHSRPPSHFGLNE